MGLARINAKGKGQEGKARKVSSESKRIEVIDALIGEEEQNEKQEKKKERNRERASIPATLAPSVAS